MPYLGNFVGGVGSSSESNFSLISLDDGSEGSPSLSYKDDANLGIYSPAQDNLAFITDGNERLRIDANGNVGIGTDNPDDRLQITGGGLTVRNEDLLGYVNLETSKEAVFGPFTNYSKARGGSTPAIVQNEDNIGNLYFKAHDGIQYEKAARIEAYVDGTPGANDMPGRLEFHTRASGATSTSERLRITSTGQAIFKGDSDITEAIRIAPTVDASDQQEFGIGFAANSNHTHPAAKITMLEYDASDSRGSLLFYTRGSNADSAPTERLRIESDGNIKVKSATQYKGFHLVKADGGTVAQLVGHASDNDEGGLNLWDGGTKKVQILSNGTSYLNGGNVGIGTNAPATSLEVASAGATGISSKSSSTQATDTNKALKVRNNSTTDTFNVSYKGQGYFAGNVGIGTTSPISKLEVVGDITITNGTQNNAIRTNAVGQLQFLRNAATNNTVAVTIDDETGNVGIGTDNPQQLLDIASTAPNIRFTDTVDGYSEIDGNAAELKFNADKGNAKADSKITFFVDNTEKVRITSGFGGNLLVGMDTVTNVNATAHFKRGINIVYEDSNEIANATAAGQPIGRILFTDARPGTYASIECGVDGTPGTNDYPGRLVFRTTPDGGSNTVERMRISSNGNVGIGTNNPGAKLEVAGNLYVGAQGTNDTTQLQIGSAPTSARTSYLDLVADTTYSDYGLRFIRYAGANGVGQIDHRGTGDMEFRRLESGSFTWVIGAGQEKVRITSGGNVGIGTDAPSHKLHVLGSIKSASTAPSILLEETDAPTDNKIWDCFVSNEELIWQARKDNLAGGGNLFKMTRASNNQIATFEGQRSAVTWFTVSNTDKRVGIGTAAPNTALHIEDSGSPVITLKTSGDDSGQRTTHIKHEFDDGVGGEISCFRQIGMSTTTAHLSFRAGGDNAAAEKMVIKADGNVGIGTNNPSYKLHVVGDIRAQGGALILNYADDANIDHLWHDDTTEYGTPGSFVFNSDTTYKNSTGGTWSNIKVGHVYVDNGNLGTTVGNIQDLARFYAYNGNVTSIRVQAKRKVAGNNWTSAGYKIFCHTDSTEQGYIEFNPHTTTAGDGNYDVAIGSGPDEIIRFKDGGNVGIGTTNPQQKLHVEGNVQINGGVLTSLLTAVIADDAYLDVVMPVKGGMIAITSFTTYDTYPQPTGTGLIYYDAGPSKHTNILVDQSNTLATSISNATTVGTFTDGKTTIAIVNTTGTIRIWNRTNAARQYKITLL